MAKRKKPRPKRHWKYRRMPKSDYVTAVARRLRNDVGPYFAAVECVRAATGTGVGFWALARMLFPVVEAVANVLYRNKRRERPPVRLLRELGFEYPNLVWEMYRHTLMHNDEMASACYMGRRIDWCITIGGGHSWAEGQGLLRVDVRRLYDDLVAFLSRAASISARKPVNVWVGESFRFNTSFGRAVRDEALKLGRRGR